MKNIIKQLQSVLGKEKVSLSKESRILSSYDATELERLPCVVVRPSTTEDVSAVMRIASENNIPVCPRGAASGLSGGAIPVGFQEKEGDLGAIALEMSEMNRILEISRAHARATAQPGILVADFQKEVEKAGLFYPPDPSSAEFSTLGGNIAECAGGLRALKYGVTRDYVLSLEVVLADGSVIRTGSKAHKSVAGYDLTRLFVGSEGTLGIFTEITVRLIPLPEEVCVVAAYFPDTLRAAQAALTLLSGKILPRSVELMDETSIKCVREYSKLDLPSGARASLLIELDGRKNCAVGEGKEAAEVLRQSGALDVRLAVKLEEREIIWDIRKQISPALYNVAKLKVSDDICVPRGSVPDLLKRVEEIGKKWGLEIASFGHAGDGNIHTNILSREDSQEVRQRIEKASEEVIDASLSLGGTITGEHGVGLTKKKYLPKEIGSRELTLMRSMKSLFDPKGILNPGKIF
jgi:glycolate oxidase